MKYLILYSFATLCFLYLADSTCVFDSDFGFTLNCNFKKSGLFRVRNLGGVKAHIGLGLSVGDDLGFPESLTNVESNKRRSVSARSTGNSVGVLSAAEQQKIQQSRPVAVTSPKLHDMNMVARTLRRSAQTQLMTDAVSLPLGVPAFRPIPQNIQRTLAAQSQQMQQQHIQQQMLRQTVSNAIPNVIQHRKDDINSVPSFQLMPQSASIPQINQLANQVNNIPENELPQIDLMGHTVEELATVANISVQSIKSAILAKRQQLYLEQLNGKMVNVNYPKFTSIPTTRQTTTTTTTTTTQRPTTKLISSITKPLIGNHKVMNAPKEYYPAGYEKNFDDNFMSKVDLPHTTFNCGEQKHFPGLYGDTDLGCMVFHVCALTDDGLVMKSFLCPESTLFDQSILKCNWWFYVDCKSSKTLYDSNIPVSKSYQLMKALTFFSKYKNNNLNDTSAENGIDIDALKNSVAVQIDTGKS